MRLNISVTHICGHTDSHSSNTKQMKEHNESLSLMPCMLCWLKENYPSVADRINKTKGGYNE